MTLNATEAVTALAALAHEHRLAVYRLLVQAGPAGLNAGTIASTLGLPPSSLSFHLLNLHRAGLVTQQRHSRRLIYAADFDVMNSVIGYLTEKCCGGMSSCVAPCEPGQVPKKTAKKSAKVA
ncbi:MAG TPA: metalloregulator ArsR/SmtB family transcription factor [Steroidobacteraceae bacterium]